MIIEPDNYFSNGKIEMARFGTNTFLKNKMTEIQHKRLRKKLQRKYPKIKKRIDRCVSSLRKQVSKCDPIELLSFASDMFLMSNLGISSEIESSSEDMLYVISKVAKRYRIADSDYKRQSAEIPR